MVSRFQKCRAYTMVELMTVLVIITILVSILLPVLFQAREKARQTVCLSNARQIGTAFLLYRQDYDGKFPLHDFSEFQMTNDEAGMVVRDWSVSDKNSRAKGILPYIVDPRLLVCPSNIGWDGASRTDLLPISFVLNGYAMGKHEAEAQHETTTILVYDYLVKSSWCSANPVPDPKALPPMYGLSWQQNSMRPPHLRADRGYDGTHSGFCG